MPLFFFGLVFYLCLGMNFWQGFIYLFHFPCVIWYQGCVSDPKQHMPSLEMRMLFLLWYKIALILV